MNQVRKIVSRMFTPDDTKIAGMYTMTTLPDVEVTTASDAWSLPPEILEIVLRRLPGRDIVLCSGVATSWRRTVANEPSLVRKVALERAWRFGDVEPKIRYKGSHICSVAKSNDLLALAGSNGVEVVDLNKWTAVVECPREVVGSVRCVYFSKQLLFVGNDAGSLFGWDLISETKTFEMKLCEGPVFAVVGFEGLVAVGGRSGYLALISLHDDRSKKLLHGHDNRITCLVVEQERNILVSGSWDMTVRVWDLTKKVCKHILKGHKNSVESLAVDGDTLLSGSCDSSIRRWSLDTGVCISTFSPHPWYIVSLGSCSSHVFSGSYPPRAKIWDHGGCCLRTFQLDSSCARNGIWGDDHRLICVGEYGQVMEWDFSEALR